MNESMRSLLNRNHCFIMCLENILSFTFKSKNHVPEQSLLLQSLTKNYLHTCMIPWGKELKAHPTVKWLPGAPWWFVSFSFISDTTCWGVKEWEKGHVLNDLPSLPGWEAQIWVHFEGIPKKDYTVDHDDSILNLLKLSQLNGFKM